MNEIKWTCDVCGFNVTSGVLHISHAAISEHQREYAEWRKRADQHTHGIPIGILWSAPKGIAWQVHHESCVPDPESSDYTIPISDVSTFKRLLWWTAHLMEKSWLESTNWGDIISAKASVV